MHAAVILQIGVCLGFSEMMAPLGMDFSDPVSRMAELACRVQRGCWPVLICFYFVLRNLYDMTYDVCLV